jgi:hypothetical protein
MRAAERTEDSGNIGKLQAVGRWGTLGKVAEEGPGLGSSLDYCIVGRQKGVWTKVPKVPYRYCLQGTP